MKKIFFTIICVFTFALSSANTTNIKSVLITGFAPFSGEKTNPSYEAVEALPDSIDGVTIIKKELPVTFDGSVSELNKYIKKYNPDVIINVGQAGGRYGISVERVAINIDDARIPDNTGDQPIDLKIYNDGNNAYFSSLPIKAINQNIKEAGIPSEVSNTAGTYVCNHIMYALMYNISKNYPNKIGGFIHVPYSPSQVVGKSEPSMSIEDMTKALKIAITTVINTKDDIKISSGKES
jgi:pyroglutamyl-peptidase